MRMNKRAISWVAVLTTLCLAATATAQENRYSTLHVGLFPPLSSNGRAASLYTNGISINLLAGVSANERYLSINGIAGIVFGNGAAVQVSGLYNHIQRDITGVAIGGIVNYIGGRANGMQIGGLLNITSAVKGMQIGGILNIADNVRGVQIGGILNMADNVAGVQIGGITNMADNTRGVQIGGFWNSTDNFSGLQIAGLWNSADNVRGMQIGGLWNSTDNFTGLQIAGLWNSTDNFTGLQIAGLWNATDNVRGAQISPILNKADRVKGLQLSLINIAEHNDYPVGLLNFIEDGEMSIALFYDDLCNIGIDFRSGGRVLYGIVGLSYDLGRINTEHPEYFSITAGIGAHANLLRWLRLDNELIVSTHTLAGDISRHTPVYNSFAYRLLLAAKPIHWLEVFAGPTVRYAHFHKVTGNLIAPSRIRYDIQTGETNIKTWPVLIGCTAGIRFVF